jgi:hypothetical protein
LPTSSLIVEDEFGYRWLVTAEMPEVQQAVSVLHRRGFRWIVLPRFSLLFPRTADLPESSIEALPPIPDNLAPDSLRRLLRLRQCAHALRTSRTTT